MRGTSRLAGTLLIVIATGCANAGPPDYPVQPVPFTQVHFDDAFWATRLETNRSVTIPHVFDMCETEGRIDNFAVAGGLMEGEQRGSYPFDDTDVYKTIEGASYALMLRPDPALEAYLDSVITLIGAAQEPDGYLYTARTNEARRLRRWFGDERWERLNGSHELYNAGHLYEAAAAHYTATGKRNLLDIALKNADLIDRTFGPGKLQKPPGHEVVEMGLVRLYRVTGEERFLNLAKFFIDMRGRPLDERELGGEYNQDHEPVVDQTEAVGHAVRAGYLYAGMADVAALTGDQGYISAVDRIWEDVVGRKLYVTGGIGATGGNEDFNDPYLLPNMSAYNETCASIANIYWNHRMFLLHAEGRYFDVMERTLYNALLSGISLEGDLFFYPNPLESIGQHARTPWFNCACCTGNVTRFIASVAGYAYGVDGRDLYLNLYAGSTAEVEVAGGAVGIQQRTRYPWDGRVEMTISPQGGSRRFALNVRIPGWASGEPVPSNLYRFIDEADAPSPTLLVNGEPVTAEPHDGYVRLSRTWQEGDVVTLDLPMPIRRVAAIDSIEADRGRVALQRGPIVYCVEWPDMPDGHVRNILLPDEASLQSSFDPDLLGGLQVIRGTARAYRRTSEGGALAAEDVPLTAIPYFAWAHRGRGEMSVWLARDEGAVRPLGYPTLASRSRVTASFGPNRGAVNDQMEPRSSIDHDVPYYHWWPHRGTSEWIQYDFPRPTEVSTVEVYWFDDTGMGECRVPATWRVLYLEEGQWRPVWTEEEYGTEKDTWNRVRFETVRTTAIRLEMQSQEGWAGGIHEWRIR
ncbi:beta-L-arabinofuranosidase domain-containing protein [Gemmatimonadota bacterium]